MDISHYIETQTTEMGQNLDIKIDPNHEQLALGDIVGDLKC